MNKYDYGYELDMNSTIGWAFSRVAENAIVLEIGPSNGNLIFHLTTEKKCTADIVEIDEEAGKQASRFARNSCIGSIRGDLERKEWYQELKANRYDYVLILDVLEHVRNPQEVLILVSSLLKEDGEILLSVPNIAHNSVVINLLHNKFEYTKVGLLDDSHVHFFTYESASQMILESGVAIKSCEARQIAVGNNEISALYGSLPRNVEAYLKTREQGTAYQFLFTLVKAETNKQIKRELSCQPDTLYSLIAFNAEDGSILAQSEINPLAPAKLNIPLKPNIKRVRIDPLDANCVISHLSLVGINSQGAETSLTVVETTGNQFGSQNVFYDNDPQIYVDVPSGIEQIRFSCEYNAFDSSELEVLAPSRDLIRQYKIDYQQVLELYKNAQNTIADLYQQLAAEKANFSRLFDQLTGLSCQLDSQKNELSRQLEAQKNELSLQLEAQKIEFSRQLEAQGSEFSHQLEEQKIQQQTTITDQAKLINELQKELNDVLTSIWGKIYYKLNK